MTSEPAALAGATGRAIAERGKALGLTWDMRPCTVETTDPLTVTFDGDVVPIGAVSIIGLVAPGTRAMGLLVPPGGAFLIGFNDDFFTSQLGIAQNVNQAGTVGSTTSATFVNAPGQPFVTIQKLWPSTQTNLLASLTIGCFSSAINTAVSMALNTAGGTGTDIEMLQALFNVAATHVYFGANKLLTGLDVGSYTLSLTWRRVSGAGTLQMDLNDWVSITAQEVWAA